MKNYQVIVSVAVVGVLACGVGKAFTASLDQTIANECSIYPDRGYCSDFFIAQNSKQDNNLQLASVNR